ncbi:MAG: DUF3943 domain-containing protein [Prevotella sp.]|nr:DUF3943 domain-containing protein [Prevotella sp.]
MSLGVLLTIGISTSIICDSVSMSDSHTEKPTDSVNAIQIAERTDSTCLPDSNVKNPWLAISEVTGTNLSILAVDHYLLNENFAKVTWHTIGRNFSLSKWYWDSDIFRTNLMFHPYHGSLYYNAARSNGMNFYTSIPFAAGGSLMWEIAGESEQPSGNDFLATSIGGIAIGEVTHRLSERIWTNEIVGPERFFREILGSVINPMGGLTRLLSGKTFHVKNSHHDTVDKNKPTIEFSTFLGGRYYGTNQGKGLHKGGGTINLDIVYGSPVAVDNRKPYDFFRASVGFDTNGGESFVTNLNIIGQIKNWILKERHSSVLSFGIYQNFDYYSVNVIKDKSPYKISEASSIGIGLAWYHDWSRMRLFEEMYLNGVLLGGSLSDYNNNRYARDYSIGSGYSVKNLVGFDYNSICHFRMSADMKHLFSWKGYEDEDNTKDNIGYSVMGDRGNVVNLILRPSFEITFNKHWGIEWTAMYVLRNFHYKYHPNTSSIAYDYRIGVKYRL